MMTKHIGGSIVATGGEVRTKFGKHHEVCALKKIALSAEAIPSPQIFELSGIGQKELLEKHSIPVLLGSPGVGEDFQDHAISAP